MGQKIFWRQYWGHKYDDGGVGVPNCPKLRDVINVQMTTKLKLRLKNLICSKVEPFSSIFQPVCYWWGHQTASRTWTPTSSRRRGSSSSGRIRRSNLRVMLRIRSRFVGPNRLQSWSALPNIVNIRMLTFIKMFYLWPISIQGILKRGSVGWQMSTHFSCLLLAVGILNINISYYQNDLF